MKKLMTICFVALMIVMGTVCSSLAGVVEFTDEVSFISETGNQQYFIDFESYGDGNSITGEPTIDGDEWLNLGIQFAGLEIGDSLILSEKAGMSVSPTHALITSNVSNRCSSLITFSTQVVSFGVYIVDNETTSPTERIILKDENGNVLGDYDMPGGAGPAPPIAYDFRGYSSTIPIAEVYIIEDSDGEGSFLDNVIYSVPWLSSPNGGEELVAGSTYSITWQTLDDSGIENVSIEYSDANGVDGSWELVHLEPNILNDGEYEWTVPQVTSDECLVRISDVADPNVSDISDDVFTIYVCRLDSIADLNNDCEVSLPDFVLLVLDWLRNGNPYDDGYTEPLPIMWVYINDPGVSGHEAFIGYMSKYETTNAQYCLFLNAALASGDINVSGDIVYGANGTNSGTDFVDEIYFNPNAADSDSQITYSGGIFSVRTRDSYDMSDHPVVEVSWYGATAFCNYYGYRLPTEWEWQAVADYDGSYTYGCGTTINQSKANYYHLTQYANPLGLSSYPYTSPVDYYSSYGYGMNDMAGNVWEWTDSIYSGSDRVVRGGSWGHHDLTCTVLYRYYGNPSSRTDSFGFRAVLN